MLYVGIDIAKNKHDCQIIDSDNPKQNWHFTIPNTRAGYQKLQTAIGNNLTNVRVGLEATGHYHYNLANFLNCAGYTTYVLNPLSVNMYHKSRSLRKTKTDKVDAGTIVEILQSSPQISPYSPLSYHINEIKGFSRLRYKLVGERSRQKIARRKILEEIFPELESIIDIHSKMATAILSTYPDPRILAKVPVEQLGYLIHKASRGYHGEVLAKKIIAYAKDSVGTVTSYNLYELEHIIAEIRRLDDEIRGIESKLKTLLTKTDTKILTKILTIPGIGINIGAMIIGEIGDFSRFSSANKVLAYAGFSPTTYQSGQFLSNHAKMEKRGSKYLRYALYNAAKQVYLHEPNFHTYYDKKHAEGKHYNVIISHIVKRLVRLFYAIEINHTNYNPNQYVTDATQTKQTKTHQNTPTND